MTELVPFQRAILRIIGMVPEDRAAQRIAAAIRQRKNEHLDAAAVAIVFARLTGADSVSIFADFNDDIEANRRADVMIRHYRDLTDESAKGE